MVPIELSLLLRLVFGQVADLMITKGYLLQSQKDGWVNGTVNIIGAATAAILLIIYQHGVHKKDMLQLQQGAPPARHPSLTRLFSWVTAAIFTKKAVAADPGITHPEAPPEG